MGGYSPWRGTTWGGGVVLPGFEGVYSERVVEWIYSFYYSGVFSAGEENGVVVDARLLYLFFFFYSFLFSFVLSCYLILNNSSRMKLKGNAFTLQSVVEQIIFEKLTVFKKS